MNIVLIPAYKPDEKLTDLACSLHNKGLTVIIVDDGSGQEYRALFEKAERYAEVVICSRNGGKGAAIKTGLAYIRGKFEAPYTVTTADADGQHRLKDIVRVSKRARSHPEALVLGYRTISREMPLRNWFGNFYTKIAFLLATGKYVSDTQTGLRAFSDRLVPFMLAVRGTRYEYETNVLLNWARCNNAIVEVPIRTIYHDGNSHSHFRAVWDSVLIYWEIIKFAAPSFVCLFLELLLFCLSVAFIPWGLHPLADNIAVRLLTATLFFMLTNWSVRRYPAVKKLSPRRFLLMEAVSLVLNTAAVWAMMKGGLPPLGAKLIANLTLFFAGITLQRKFFYVDTDKRR